MAGIKENISELCAYREPPEEYLGDAPAAGSRVVSFGYMTRDRIGGSAEEYGKNALVYLPEGYDGAPDRRFNVLYLMHGGGDTPAWYFNGEGCDSELKHLLDCMIRDDVIEPLIVCTVSYYTLHCEDAARNCLGFRYELTNDLMPAFEKEYRTYASDVTESEFVRSRRHRAFSGFSMGAVTTWNVLGYCLDRFAYFIPMSGDCWELGTKGGGIRPDDTAAELRREIAASGYTSKDFYIYAGCGDTDIAEPNLSPQTDAMSKLTDTFVWSGERSGGNLYRCICPGCGHDRNAVLRTLYNGLPKLFR